MAASPHSSRSKVWVRTAGSDAASVTGARSTQSTPSAKLGAIPAATSTARRVLPTPPAPIRVTRRAPANSSASSALSWWRPMNSVRGTGSLSGRRGGTPPAGIA